MTFLSAIVLLGVIIFVHELGHFLFAKLMKVKVLKFSLGFGPKLLGRQFGETEYVLSAVPLGGYVKMLGETPGDELSEEEKLRAFNYQKIWKRFAIVVAGPLFNILCAAVIFFVFFLSGLPVLVTQIGEVAQGTPAEAAGLRAGDRIIEIEGKKIEFWDEMTSTIHSSPGKQLNLKVQRDDEIFSVTISPERKQVKDIFGEIQEVGLIGIKPSGKAVEKKENPAGAFVESISRTWELSVLTLESIIKLFQRVIPLDTLGGPVMIVQLAGQQAEQGLLNFFFFMAIININLGVLNLLPIPILDGGHLMFLGIEAVRRKPISQNVVAISQKVGLVILLSLMAFVIYNDVARLITGRPLP
jgi:regulator of sigma E protease